MNSLPPIHSQAELEATWRRLMSPLGFDEASLWVMTIRADGTPTGSLIELQGDEIPETLHLDGLAGLLVEQSDGVRAAFLRARPGLGRPTPHDQQWAAELYAACQRTGLPCEVIHLATDEALFALPWDALPGALTA